MRKTAMNCVGLLLCASASGADPAATDREIQELKERIGRLEDRQKSARPLDLEGLRLFGYGEAHYNNPKTGTMSQKADDRGDFHRLVLGWEHEFDTWVRFAGEVEWEHAGSTIELEYAALDFDLCDSATATAGALLMPVGMLNESHEPTLFWSVERPYFERSVIPSTWQELGFGVKTRWMEERLKYRAYIVQGLDAELFTGADGIRGGRGLGGRETRANDFAFVQRAEYAPLDWLDLGVSMYQGEAGQDERNALGEKPLQGVDVHLYEADARVRQWGFDLRASWAVVDLGNAARLNRYLATTATTTIGSEIQGWYAETGYHLLQAIDPRSKQDLVLFYRAEEFDTNHGVQGEGIRTLAQHRKIVTVGLAWFPVRNVAIKTDYEDWEDASHDEVGRWNLGIAFMF